MASRVFMALPSRQTTVLHPSVHVLSFRPSRREKRIPHDRGKAPAALAARAAASRTARSALRLPLAAAAAAAATAAAGEVRRRALLALGVDRALREQLADRQREVLRG